jgi:hypothetical protein
VSKKKKISVARDIPVIRVSGKMGAGKKRRKSSSKYDKFPEKE